MHNAKTQPQHHEPWDAGEKLGQEVVQVTVCAYLNLRFRGRNFDGLFMLAFRKA